MHYSVHFLFHLDPPRITIELDIYASRKHKEVRICAWGGGLKEEILKQLK